MMERNYDVPAALYHSIGKYIVLDTISERQERKIIQKAMELRAVRTLEDIRCVLEDKTLDDPECFYRIDALVMLYFRELEINIDRHNELE